MLFIRRASLFITTRASVESGEPHRLTRIIAHQISSRTLKAIIAKYLLTTYLRLRD